MNPDLRSSHRLVKRGAAGLACDEGGVALGSVSLISARKIAGGGRLCSVRSPDEIGAILRTGYGPQPAELVSRLHRGLRRAAAWIEAGDIGRAGVEALMLGLPDLTSEAMLKLDGIADIEKRGEAWETEPRVPKGQVGGGQWITSGDATAAAVRPVSTGLQTRRDEATRTPLPCATPIDTSLSNGVGGPSGIDRNLLVHVNSAAVVANGFSAAEDFALPSSIARLGQLGLLAFAASLLNNLDAIAARNQITNAIKRFGLNPNRPADVIAATAYVWSRYQLPFIPSMPASGPGFDAASKAVMLFVLANPGAFTSMTRNSANLIMMAAMGGLSDLNLESSARPQGVDPALQTRSERARAAIALNLRTGRWAAHHLLPVSISKENADLALLAKDNGWRADLASNLIGLPRDASAQLAEGEVLPLHNGRHYGYNNDTRALIAYYRGIYPRDLTPVEANSILRSVADINRAKILSSYYNPAIKTYS